MNVLLVAVYFCRAATVGLIIIHVNLNNHHRNVAAHISGERCRLQLGADFNWAPPQLGAASIGRRLNWAPLNWAPLNWAPTQLGATQLGADSIGRHSIGRRLNWAPPDWAPTQLGAV